MDVLCLPRYKKLMNKCHFLLKNLDKNSITDYLPFLQWEQFTWMLNQGEDNSVLREVVIVKNENTSALRLSWLGDLRIACGTCCKRWFFKIDGHECTNPTRVEGVIYQVITCKVQNVPYAECRITTSIFIVLQQ